MKKLLLMGVSALMALTANAGTLYLVGSGTVDGKSLGGSPNGNCLAVTSTNNVYTFTVNNIGWLKISDTNASDWSTFNKNGFTIDGKGDYALKASDLGQTFKLWYSNGSSEGTNNINPPSNGEYTYTLTVGDKGQSNSTLVVTSKSTEVITYDIYLRGSFNSFGVDAAYKFTPDASGKVYSLAGVTLSQGTTFKIADANWGAINYGNGQKVNANTEYTLTYNGNDMTLNQDINNATITFNIDTEVMYIKDETADPDVPVTPDYDNYWVHVGGAFNSNNFYDDGIQPVDGIATFSNLAIGNGTFKVHVWDGSKDIYYIMDSPTSDNQVPTGEWVQFVVDGYDIYDYVKGATASSVYNVQYNVATNQIYLTLVSGGTVDPTPNPTLPETLYMLGNVNGYSWSTSQGVEANGNEGVYTYSEVTVDDAGNNVGYINLATVIGEDWGAVNSGNRYGALESDASLADGETAGVKLFVAVTDAPNCFSWKVPAGKYNFVVDLNALTISATLIEGGDIPVDPDPDPTPNPENVTAIYVVGAGDGLGWDLPGKEYTVTNDVVSFTIDNLSKFKVSINKADEWEGEGQFNAGCYGIGEGVYFDASQVYPAGQTLPMVLYGQDLTLPFEGNYTITYDFKNMTVTAKASEGESEGPKEIYLRGGMNDWGTTDKFEYNATDDSYSWTGTIEAGVEFKIADGNWGTVNYGFSDALSISDPTTIELVYDGANMKLNTAFTGTVIFKITGTQKATATFVPDSSAVGVIEAAQGQAVYFNLQGVKVQNPDKGIFIKVVDGKAVKVVL